MLKINDYQPFNSVIHNGKVVTIVNIDDNGYYLSNTITCNREKLSPIPLVKENISQNASTFFHLSSGLLHILVDNVDFTVDTHNGVCIVENKVDKTKGRTYKDIVFLHQLQNLICEHTGIKFFLQSNDQQY